MAEGTFPLPTFSTVWDISNSLPLYALVKDIPVLVGYILDNIRRQFHLETLHTFILKALQLLEKTVLVR